MRGFSFLLGRIVVAASVSCGVLAIASCAALLGIDEGSPMLDAADGSSGSDDATTASDGPTDKDSDGTVANDSSDSNDVGNAADAMDAGGEPSDEGFDAGDGEAETIAGEGGDASSPDGGDAGATEGGDACASDPNWCTNHCASGPDLCGVNRQCTDYCTSPWACDPASRQCVCQHDPTWCNGRCGITNDNCGTMVDCHSCEGGVACNAAHTCGCSPQPNPCGAMLCGQTMDSCQHPVSCGVDGMCAGGGICDVATGTCCSPIANPCSGRCSGSVDNGCNQQINCSSPCGPGEVCSSQGSCVCPAVVCGNACGPVSNGCTTFDCTCSGPGQVCNPATAQCCTPTGGCSPTCLDNCGQAVPCCPEAGPPPDAGFDGGSCSPPGSPCPGGQSCCNGAVCNANEICVPSCSTTICQTLANCCYGFTACGPGIIPFDGGGAQPMVMPLGMCQ